jgi:para-aminobenzoate synthetase/4-amino-4-deoxychorismate lyase
VNERDYRLCHKTSDRAFYDNARKEHDADEVLFVRPDGKLTEGSVSALFVERDGMLVTPPVELGLLPSVLARELVETGKAQTASITAADLTGSFFMGNSLRGLIRATRVA